VAGRGAGRLDAFVEPLNNAVWFTSRMLGAEAAGGDEVVPAARERLGRIGWKLWVEDPALPDRPLR